MSHPFTANPGSALLTGASGFVGAAVARALRARAGGAARSHGRPARPPNLLGLGHEKLRSATSAIHRARGGGAAGIREPFHVAADYRSGRPPSAELVKTNVEGTRTSWRRPAGRRRAARVYQQRRHPTAARPMAPPETREAVAVTDMRHGAYKRSKVLAERLARTFPRAGLPAVIVNPSTPIGPRDVSRRRPAASLSRRRRAACRASSNGAQPRACR